MAWRRVGGAPHGTLPAAGSRLVPRDGERAGIECLLLGPETRLASLVGAPGSGKTRLALMVAASLASAFPDGIVFVDLSVLRDPDTVPSAAGASESIA